MDEKRSEDKVKKETKKGVRRRVEKRDRVGV
jgi:hypothetical protein